MLHPYFITMMALLLVGCGGDKFDQKSYNQIGKAVKAEMNKLSIPCPVSKDGIGVVVPDSLQLQITDGILKLYKKQILIMDDQTISIIPNKVTADGFQFTYEADITEYSLDRGPLVTRDAGTIWLYCDKHKKHNEPKAEPTLPTSKMVTVE